MFVYRYISLFTFVVIYSFGLQLNSLAIEPTSKKNILLDRTIAAKADLPNDFRQEYIIIAAKSADEQTENVDKRLSLLGIAITSVGFLFMVFLLFKPEKKQDQEQTETALVDREAIESVENEATSLKAESDAIMISEQNTDLSESQERSNPKENESAEPVFPMIGMEQGEDLERLPISNREIAEIDRSKLIKPETTVAEISEQLANASEPKVNSDLMGKVTIVRSQTTEIDVVFELIQDLQNNSSAKGIGAKDLRRKAIWELGQTNDFRAVEHLIQIMPEVESLEKSLILDSITRIANRSLETVNNVLLTCLDNECVEVRKKAIKDLTYLYQSLSLVAVHLAKMTEDSDTEVRDTAKWALKQFDKISFPVASIEEK